MLLIYQHKNSETDIQCRDSTFDTRLPHGLSILRRVTSRITVKLSHARFKYMPPVCAWFVYIKKDIPVDHQDTYRPVKNNTCSVFPVSDRSKVFVSNCI